MIFASSLCKIFETCIPKTAIKSHVTSYYSLLMIIQVLLIFASSVGINLGMPHSENYPLNPQYPHVPSYYSLLMIAQCALKDDVSTCGIKMQELYNRRGQFLM